MVSTVLGLSGPPAPRPVVTVFKQENEPVQIQNHNMVDGTARTSEIRNISDPAKLFSVLVSCSMITHLELFCKDLENENKKMK